MQDTVSKHIQTSREKPSREGLRLQTWTNWSLYVYKKKRGRQPHLEPSSLPFLSNSVETLRRMRRSDREEEKQGEEKKQNLWVVHDSNNFRSIPVNKKKKEDNMWRVIRSDTEVKRRREPPPKKTPTNNRKYKKTQLFYLKNHEKKIKTSDECSDCDPKLKPTD